MDTIKEKLASALQDNFKGEEKDFVNPWSKEDKASVLQQSRCFSASPIDSERCLGLLTKVLYLLSQGEKFTPSELSTLFFDVTKLFQASSVRLRRMVYLVIKELEPAEQEVFICMSCLIKDMNSTNDSFRANSIRVLSRIVEPSLAAQIDRYLKTAIVDKNAFVASSALLCGINLIKTVPDVVKRWVNEIQETISSKHQMVQFHALALIYEVKRSDRLALHKVVANLAATQLKSPMAECLLVRYASQALMAQRDAGIEKLFMALLDTCIRHRSETVQYEAARAFCNLAILDDSNTGGHTVFGYDITHATTVLQIFLTSPKPVLRFGAIRTLNTLAQHRPAIAARCNCDMEPLLSDKNRNIATLALTTLLKTGHESNVERLVKQITTFMSDISDVFKIEVVRAVKGLCLQYPAKYKTLMAFLSTNLREDGTQNFKRDLTDAIIIIIVKVPAAREVGLLHLCEFIEDCEYPNLCTQILNFLGEEVPSTALPAKYIRFIYNRLILENALVRAAAVDALTKIAMKCPALRRDVLVLFQFGQNDNDDEVRDRISLYSTVLQQCLDEGGEDAQAADSTAKMGFQALMSSEMPFSLDALYDSLLDHMNCDDTKNLSFDVSSLPSEETYQAAMKANAVKEDKKKPGGPAVPAKQTAAESAAAVAEQRAASNTQLLAVISEIVPVEELGPLQHSCSPTYITESEAEYTVQVTKHMFRQHVVLDVYVSNTVSGVALENIEARLTGVEGNWIELGSSMINRLEFNQQASAHVVLRKTSDDEDAAAVRAKFGAALHFLVKEEEDDVGYEDDYPIEAIAIGIGDYMNPRGLPQGQFKSVFDSLLAQGTESTQKMSLNYKTLEAAVGGIANVLNMMACDNTNQVEAGVRGHTLLLSGVFIGGHTVLVKALVGMDASHGCAVAKLSCRCKSQSICEAVARSLM